MDFDELLDLLEIDTIDDFCYFENYAALIEYDETIPYELFFKVVSKINPDTLLQLTNDYFEDILNSIPTDGIEVFTLIQTIKQALEGLAKSSSNSEECVLYADELFKFRNWFVFDSIVTIRDMKEHKKFTETVLDALTRHRTEKFTNEEFQYDFSEALDYELDEYSISLDASIDEEYEEIIEEDEELYEEGLVDKEYPVIDGENYDYENEDDYKSEDDY